MRRTHMTSTADKGPDMQAVPESRCAKATASSVYKRGQNVCVCVCVCVYVCVCVCVRVRVHA